MTLKLGRKKTRSLMRKDLSGTSVFDYMSSPHGTAEWAVPVADSRTPVKTDERASYVSDPANPGRHEV